MRRMSLLLVALMSCFAATAGVRPGDVPPDPLGPTMDGHTVSLASLRGKVVVISFWATWCGYCMKEMPVLAKMQSLATKRGMSLQVVAVNYKEDRRVFLRAARALGKSLPELLLTWDRHGAIGKPYDVTGIPVMVMLHRDGTVAHVHVGYGEDMLGTLVEEINALLREPPIAAPVLAPR